MCDDTRSKEDAHLARMASTQAQVEYWKSHGSSTNSATDKDMRISMLQAQIAECQLQSGQRQIKIDTLLAERESLRAALREVEALGGTDGYYCFYLDGLSKETQDVLKGA